MSSVNVRRSGIRAWRLPVVARVAALLGQDPVQGATGLGERLTRLLDLALVALLRHLPGGLGDLEHLRADLGQVVGFGTPPRASPPRGGGGPLRRGEPLAALVGQLEQLGPLVVDAPDEALVLELGE